MTAPQPQTTFVNGINPFLARGALPATQPKKARTMPKLPGRPAKPASGKTLPKDEDYSTPYRPPVPIWPAPAPLPQTAPLPTPTVDESLTPATPQPTTPREPVQLPTLDAIPIDDDVPLPARGYQRNAQAKVNLLTALLGKLQPRQSAPLPIGIYATLNKLISATHKTGPARFATRRDKTAQTLRVWRVS